MRRRLGVVFQHPSLDGKLTVGENLAAHGHLYGITGKRLRERSAAMLERLGLSARERDRVETLSGGLQRRVELAKALLHEPALLLLDEPSTGLDPAARREFWNYLEHLRENEGVTVVLTTHYMEEAERCDRIGIMHQGKLVAIAPPDELKSEVGGDVIVIRTEEPEILQRKILARFKLKSQLVDGAIRIEKLRAHELVRDLIDAFGEEIESVSFGKPTLEDVFVHLTGHQFFANTRGDGVGGDGRDFHSGRDALVSRGRAVHPPTDPRDERDCDAAGFLAAARRWPASVVQAERDAGRNRLRAVLLSRRDRADAAVHGDFRDRLDR